jgi:hypothetical protein
MARHGTAGPVLRWASSPLAGPPRHQGQALIGSMPAPRLHVCCPSACGGGPWTPGAPMRPECQCSAGRFSGHCLAYSRDMVQPLGSMKRFCRGEGGGTPAEGGRGACGRRFRRAAQDGTPTSAAGSSHTHLVLCRVLEQQVHAGCHGSAGSRGGTAGERGQDCTGRMGWKSAPHPWARMGGRRSWPSHSQHGKGRVPSPALGVAPPASRRAPNFFEVVVPRGTVAVPSTAHHGSLCRNPVAGEACEPGWQAQRGADRESGQAGAAHRDQQDPAVR